MNIPKKCSLDIVFRSEITKYLKGWRLEDTYDQ